MWRTRYISPPSGMAAMRQIPLKEEKIVIISDWYRKYKKILHAPTEAKKIIITLYKQTRKNAKRAENVEHNKTSKKTNRDSV